MSEFSESYHLRSDNSDDAVELLRRAKRKGYVYPPGGGWVSFVADAGVFEPDDRIAAAATRPLLHFVSAEDHGWGFTLFEGGKVVSKYNCEWEDDVTADDSQYSRDAIQRIIPSVDPAMLDEFERRMHPEDIDDLLSANRPRMMAQVLGLENYEWLNYDYLASDSPDDHPGVIEVS